MYYIFLSFLEAGHLENIIPMSVRHSKKKFEILGSKNLEHPVMTAYYAVIAIYYGLIGYWICIYNLLLHNNHVFIAIYIRKSWLTLSGNNTHIHQGSFGDAPMR
jgi:hypothetical protein